jgi:hypothetical protein
LLLSGIFLALAILLPGSAIAERLVDAGGPVAWGAYDVHEVRGNAGDTLRLSLNSTAAVDLLLMPPDGFAAYRDAQDASGRYVSGSALAVEETTVTFSLPGSGAYLIVVDNTDAPREGAASGVPVNYTLTVDREPASPLTAVCALALIAGVIAGTAVLLWMSRRARKGPAGSATVETRPPLTVCGNCGGMTGGTDRCTICGEPLPADELKYVAHDRKEEAHGQQDRPPGHRGGGEVEEAQDPPDGEAGGGPGPS